MNPWFGILGLFAGFGAVAWYGHKQINRIDNYMFAVDAGVRATSVGPQYLTVKSNFPAVLGR